MSIKSRFELFTTRIRPTIEHIEEANRQTDYMIKQLKSMVAEDERFTLEKVLQAGSNAKHTSLRRTEENVFDADLGAYYSGQGATRERLSTLLTFTRDRLLDIYPTKSARDFEVLQSAVRVKFRGGIKLNVDVAPIIRDDSVGIENGGWIPRSDGWRLTSVTCHNEFVRSRTARSKQRPGPVKFNRLERLMKWWNNLQDDLMQPSYFCDLITAAAVEKSGVTDEWQSSLRNIFTFLRKHQFLEPIVFSDYYDAHNITLPTDLVIVLDAVNPENNVTRNWTEATRQGYLERVQVAYDAMMDARSWELEGNEKAAVDAWCEVFGEEFRTLSEEEE
ncbi:MAG TPA: CBASS oligonucleotide cyclase [Ktedonobacteraceae bacterium]|nr:CBASS oligonucleotide cyclase [Ktedonobacteraceae bacterium]